MSNCKNKLSVSHFVDMCQQHRSMVITLTSLFIFTCANSYYARCLLTIGRSSPPLAKYWFLLPSGVSNLAWQIAMQSGSHIHASHDESTDSFSFSLSTSTTLIFDVLSEMSQNNYWMDWHESWSILSCLDELQ